MLGLTTGLCGNDVSISVCSTGDVVCENGNMDSSLNSSQDSRFLDSIAHQLDFGGLAQSLVDTKADTDRFKKPLSLPAKRDPATPLAPVLPPTKVNNSTIGVETQGSHRVSHLVGNVPDHSWSKTSDVHSSSEQSPRPIRKNSTPPSGQDRAVEPSSMITPDTVHTTTTFKITPPMCRCGRRTRENTVYKEGPNQGRTFFTCSRRNGCGYFEWQRSWSETNNCELYSEYDF